MNHARRHHESPIARAVELVRDPYHVERMLGIVLWVGFALVLLSLGD